MPVEVQTSQEKLEITGFHCFVSRFLPRFCVLEFSRMRVTPVPYDSNCGPCNLGLLYKQQKSLKSLAAKILDKELLWDSYRPNKLSFVCSQLLLGKCL